MLRSRSGAALALLSFGMLTVSCGGSGARGPVVPEVAKPVAAPRGDQDAPPVDTSRPKDLVVVARFRDPEETIDAASALSGTPISMALAVVAQTQDGRGLSTLDLRAHVDLAVVWPPGAAMGGPTEEESVPPVVGITFGVVDVERAAASLPEGWTARPWRGGLRIRAAGLECEVPTRGHAPARVFCASSELGQRLLSGWMTRTLVSEPLPAVDGRITILAAPARAQVRSMIATELRGELGDARDSMMQLGVGDPELLGVPGALVDELEALAEDSDQLEIDLDLDSVAKTATARTTVRFRSATGWVARVLADPAERRGPPPPIFWRAPKDSDSASWSMAASPRHFTGIRRIYDKAVRLAAERAQLKPDETQALVAAVNGIPSVSGGWFAAQGRIAWKAPPKGRVTPQNAVADLKDRARAYVGWGMVGLEAPAQPWVSWFGQLETAWKKGILVAKRELSGSDDLNDLPDLKLVRNPGGYPAGTVALDVTLKFDSKNAWATSPRLSAGVDGLRPEHPAGKPVRGTATLRVVVVPDGPRTFVAWALDDPALRAHVRAALHDAPESGTIAQRADLRRLARDGTGGGYFTLAPWGEMAAQLAAEEEPGLTEAMKLVADLPNKAATPILTFADGTLGNAPTLTFEVVAQEGTIEDVRAMSRLMMSKGLEQMFGGPALMKTPDNVPPQPVVPVPVPVPPRQP